MLSTTSLINAKPPFVIMLMILINVVVACTPTQVRQAPSIEANQEIVTTESKVDEVAEQLMLAEENWKRTGDVYTRNQHLLMAARLALKSDRTSVAQQILHTALLDAQHDGTLVQARLLAAEMYFDEALASQTDIEQWLNSALQYPALFDDARRLLIALLIRQERWHEAAMTLSKSDSLNENDTALLWQSLDKLDDQGLNSLGNNSMLIPFIELQQLMRNAPTSLVTLTHQLAVFRNQYAGHPIVNYWPIPTDILENTFDHDTPVAVLLPLSGKFAATGDAIRAGLLHAYYQEHAQKNAAREMIFFDTEVLSADVLLEAIAPYPVVLGPLRRDLVEALAPRIPEETLLLAFNVPEQSPTSNTANSRQFYFALSPEQEAIQLAEVLHQQGARHPIVAVSDNGLYQRMYEAFRERWQQLSTERGNLTSVVFNDNENLRDGITHALGVSQSKTRFDQLRFMTNMELHYMPRNRTDIDAVAVFASPEETELLNPIIEASLTPHQLTSFIVMATSRSVDYDNKLNQWRDLHNMYFFDMPWLLNNSDWKQQRQSVEQIWPDASTQFLRFFALGHDAYVALPQLELLSKWPSMKFMGLSGRLSVSDDHHVLRELSRAQVRQYPQLLGN